jgi:hypothetical protein
MPNDPILLKTAKEEIRKIEKAGSDSLSTFETELWPNLARLYSAAVLQISHKPPYSLNITGLPDLDIIRSLPPNFKPSSAAIEEYFKLFRLIVTSEIDIMSDLACYLVQILGPPLYERLKFLIETEQFPNPPQPPSDIFRVQLNGLNYILMLSNMDDSQCDNSFADLLVDAMPKDGWDEKAPKLYPPLVRLLPCINNDPDKIPNIFYLSTLNPKVDEALNSISVDQGLGLTAIPMHRNIVFDIEKMGKTKGGQIRFRIQEPESWPDGWEKELEDQILLCSKNKIAIAALPELCGSPRVLEVVRKALLKCKNNFPILFIAGSWHTDIVTSRGNSSFVNRLSVFSAFDPYEPLISHDKFEPFAENGYKEENEPGTKGLTFLVTSIGVIAFGICKDLFVERASREPKAQDQINAALPFLTVCPAMTATIREPLHSASTLFKNIHSLFLVSNACGVVREIIRDGVCCKEIQEQQGQKRMGDARSFISAPNNLYKMTCLENNKSIIKSEYGIFLARSSCPGQGRLKPGQSYTNTVSACLKIKGVKS